MNKVSNRRLARGFVAHLKNGKDPKQLINMLAAEIIATKQISKLDLIIAEIARELEVQMATSNIKVYSARELSPAIKISVANMVKLISNTDKVIIDEQIDPSLLGGVKIETPEREIDLSIQHKLRKIGGRK